MRRLFFISSLFFLLFSFFPLYSHEAQAQCAGTVRNGICFPTRASTGGLSEISVEVLLMGIMNWLLGIVGILGIIAFVISGVQYLTAAGDDNQIETAKNNMKYSIIGIIVALSGYVVIQAIDMALRGSQWF